MKKIVFLGLSLVIAINAGAQLNLGTIIEKVSGSEGSTSSTIGSILGNIVATDNIELNQLVGTWNYSSPAVGFQSADILKKVGGSAASSQIENELVSYYKSVGLDNLKLTVAEDASFSMKTKYATLKGVIEKGENGTMIFNFKAFGKVKIGKLKAYTTLSGSTLSITFNVKKLVELAKKISKYSNAETIKSLISLVDSYEGITAGFKLKKQ